MKKLPIVFPDPEASFVSYMRRQEALHKYAVRKSSLVKVHKLTIPMDGCKSPKSGAALTEEMGKPETADQS